MLHALFYWLVGWAFDTDDGPLEDLRPGLAEAVKEKLRLAQGKPWDGTERDSQP